MKRIKEEAYAVFSPLRRIYYFYTTENLGELYDSKVDEEFLFRKYNGYI